MNSDYSIVSALLVMVLTGCGQSGESKKPATPPVAAPEAQTAQISNAPATSAALLSSSESSVAGGTSSSVPVVSQMKNLAVRNLDPEKIRHGEVLYQTHCANCHGKNGEGAPDWRNRGADGKFPPPPLDDTAHAWHHSTKTLTGMIRDGSQPGTGNMPSWKDKLSDQDILDVTDWIKSLWSDEIYDTWKKEIEHREKASNHG